MQRRIRRHVLCGSTYTGGWRIANAFGSSLSTYIETLDFDDDPCCSYWNQLNAYWTDPQGTKHRYLVESAEISVNGATLESVDGDRSKIVFDNNWSTNGRATLYLANGSTLYFDNQLPNKVTTPNGNYLVNSTNGSKLPAQDTLGRTVTYTAGTIGSTADKYRIKDSSNTDRDYEILYKTHSAWNPWAGANETRGSDRTVIDTITLPNGKTWTFEYSHDQRFITKVTMPTGAYVKYEYYGGSTSHNAADDHLTARKVSATGNSQDEKTWTYSRSESGGVRTITVTSPEGDQVVHTFNDKGQETATAWKNSSGTTMKSQATTWTQGTTLSNGQPTNPKVTTIVTTLDGGLSATETRTLSNGLVTETTQTGYGTSTIVAKKTMTYTTINATVPRDAISTETVYGIDPAGSSLIVQGKTEYFYDQFTMTNRGTSVPNHTHNTSESNRGNLTKVRRYKDATNYVEVQTKYDNLGNVVETIDPLNRSTTVDFTDNFTDSTNRYSFAYPKTVTNALSQSTTSKYDFNTGLVKEILNLRGNATTTAYDLLNRITSVTEPAVGGTSKVTTYAYDDTNRKTTKEVTVDTSGNKGHVETFFDKLYRTVKVVTNDPEGAITVETEYDANGRVKKTSNPYRSGDTVVWTQSAYDGLSRPLTVTAPDSSTVSYSYANNITTTTDQAGNQRRYTYNVLGQLTAVEEPNPTLDTAAVTSYTYYGFGPLYQSNQSSQTRTWVYNWLGQMTSQTLPESGTTTFTYNAAGLLATKTDARSIVTTMTYDNANRPTQRSYSDSTPTVSFTYDQNGYTGQRTTMTDGLGSATYTFDARDRLTQESRTLTGVSGTFSTSYVYNVKGDVTQMTYPSGRVVNFAYATGGGCCNSRLSSVSDGTTSTTLLNSITFSAAGGVLTQTLNPSLTAVSQTFTYNNRLQQTQIQAAVGSTTLMNFSYNYGTSSTNTGRVLSRTDAVQPEHSANYVYDSIYRLSQAAGADASWGVAWTFDTWGNRLTQTPAGLATSKVGSPQIAYTSNRNQAHTYDNAGNTTNDTVHSYAFNAENQQTSMDGGAAIYAYDGEGRRMKKVTSSETTYTFYGPGGILCEFSTSTALSSATAAASTDKTLYRTSERTGTAVLLFNTAGTVIENNRTLPYGEAWLADIASANDKKFTTYDRDQESGLDYAMARMYGNAGGRFTTPDQGPSIATKPTTLNRYTYGNLDPINHSDQSGNMSARVELDTHCTDRGGSITGIWIAQFGWLLPNGAFEVGRDWIDGYECDFPDVPAAETAMGQGGGGGGGAGGFTWGSALGASRARIQLMLQSGECAGAIGARTSKAAVDRAGKIDVKLKNSGQVREELKNGSVQVTGEMAHYRGLWVTRWITFNNQINWEDPSNTVFRRLDGTLGTVDLLAGYRAEVGASSMTPQQFMDLTLLHELGHSYGKDADAAGFDKNIWEKCFK